MHRSIGDGKESYRRGYETFTVVEELKPRRPDVKIRGNRVSPYPRPRGGKPSRQGGGWGNPGSPFPTVVGSGWRPHRQERGEPRVPHFPTAVGSGWRPHRQERGEPRVPLREGVGETRFPHSPTAVGSGWRLPQAGVRFDRLTAGGEPRFPHSPTAVGSGWRPSGRGLGNPGFPSGRGVGKPGFPISQPPLGAAGTP